MMTSVLLILLASSVGGLAEDLRMEPEYSPASPMHSEPMYASASEMSPYPQHLDLNTLKDMPLLILHPRTPIKLKMVRGENMQDVYKSLTPERIIKLLKSAASTYSQEGNPTPKKASLREAKSIDFGSSQARSILSLPFGGGHQGLLPSGSNPFSRPFIPHQTGGGWQQRFRNSFSNMFSFAKPFNGMAATNRPVFMPSPQHGFQIPGSYNPYQQQFNTHPSGMWNQFQPAHSLSPNDFSTAASFGHPTKLQLGSFFNPYHHNTMHQQQFGGDLAMSGATMIPHRVVPAASHAFAHYVSTVPRHKPLFNNVGGLKGASLEIRNAFADFTSSDEHGPEVSQKFGSVGHVMNKFLDMMGLGAAGGITDDFGGAGNWASMDSTPISRSMDFYPGYGNQAHLDDIEDFPIFLEDITEHFLTKMNLTHLLKNDSKTLETDSKKETTNTKSSSSDKEKPKDPSKMKEKSVEKSKEKMSKPDAPADPIKDLPKYSDYLYVPAQTLEMMQNKNKVKGSTSKEETKPSPDANMKKDTSSDDGKKGPDSTQDSPIVNYQVPSTLSTVSPQDRILPVAIFSSFPSKSNDEPAPAPPSYSQAMPLPQHEFEDNPNKLVDEDELRQWVPVSNGRGYVEKRPKPFVDITKTADQPKGLKIVEQLLSGSTRTY